MRSSSVLFKLLPFFLLLLLVSWSGNNKGKQMIFQLTVYQYSSPEQEKLLDQYLQQALIPALHKLKIEQVGVFKAIANDTAFVKKIYVLLPGSSIDELAGLGNKLAGDADYLRQGSAYLNAAYTTPPYTRMELLYLKAFPLAPSLQLPDLKAPKAERVYELRSYESATEAIFRNKVTMFNEGDEIGIFKKLRFNAIFYSEVLAGSKMPNLMYMLGFENMDDRNAHWKNFVSDTAWKTLSGKAEYQHNISHIDVMFFHPADYSDY